jgi:hypothetical protein
MPNYKELFLYKSIYLTLIHKVKKFLKKHYITLKIQMGLEVDNKFWIDMCIHIHVPNNIVLWALNATHPIIVFITT